jgi:Domain of unknown function (DUF397)
LTPPQPAGQPLTHSSTQLLTQPAAQEYAQFSGRTLASSPTKRRRRNGEDNVMNEFDKPVAAFRKSSFSGSGNPNCVEVGFVTAEVMLRDSKHQDGPVLRFTTDEWKAFLAGVKAGEFDLD